MKRVLELINRITMSCLGNKSFRVIVAYDKKGGNRIYIQIEYIAPCTKTNENLPWKGRKWYLSEHMTDNEIIFTVYTAYKMAIEHELMEGFKIDGIILVNPHVDYKELLSISSKEVTRQNPNP